MQEFQKRLDESINKLTEIVSRCNTEELIGYIAVSILASSNGDLIGQSGLSSPLKQYLYLGGLTLSTAQLQEEIEFDEVTISKIYDLLEDIVYSHSLLFFPSEDTEITDSWRKARQVSMPVFLNYFNTAPLNYSNQLLERIDRWFMQYDAVVKDICSISVKEMIEIYHHIERSLQDIVFDTSNSEDNFIQQLESQIKDVEQGNISFEEFMSPSSPAAQAALDMYEQSSKFNQISISELKKVFDNDVIDKFVENFSLVREQREFKYYTQENPFENAPLWKKSEDTLYCVHPKLLLNAIFNFLYKTMEKSQQKENWYKHRDKQAEDQTINILKKIFGENAEYFPSVFETAKSQNEHDLVIRYGDKLFIVEVKASKFKEPFRDPDKAYNRIRNDFRSEGGLQKAADQGYKLKKLILSQDETNLYNQNGDIITVVNRDTIQEIFIFCITAENTGIIGANLSLLLQKENNEPYPWSCNLFDLDTLLDGFVYKGLSSAQFIEYIRVREKLHERFLSSDELEIAGYFLRYGNFNKLLESKATHYFFTPDMANIFDEIYFEKNGIPFESEESSEPYMVDVREKLIEIIGTTDNVVKTSAKKISTWEKKKRKNKLAKSQRKKNRKR
ncbi:hypothetical protein ABE205_21840 [Brevibacillus agri]|uniref:hypothetical protein n=1 Tax=Brevibacillus agri TaxID=51101 RepID=UPI003D1F90F1